MACVTQAHASQHRAHTVLRTDGGPMLPSPPIRARSGVAVFKNVTARAWGAWTQRQTALINELRLDLSAHRVRLFVLRRMEGHLFGNAAQPG
ncbi:putative Fe(2+)-trafficking protein [Candidatus Tremblaya princeps]|uniref:Putative Fe(2+)-trafficking protein n=1 Tax=Tremblaya princeps TaxID=189385 RepID=A0A143WNB3_TREPR|nr:putative Fe(2+)-trafficking protein [Candidatus Tremblaya princeps]